jgi:hypothetical protein
LSGEVFHYLVFVFQREQIADYDGDCD